jgi:hypothetical protein
MQDLQLNLLNEADLRVESGIIETIVSRMPYAQGDEVTVTEEEFYFKTNEVFLFLDQNTSENLKPYYDRFLTLKIFRNYPTIIQENCKDAFKFYIDKYLVLSYADKIKEEKARRERKHEDWCWIENNKFFIKLKNNSLISFGFPNIRTRVLIESLFEDWKSGKSTKRDEIIRRINLLGETSTYNELSFACKQLNDKIKIELGRYSSCVRIERLNKDIDTYTLKLIRV